MSSIYIKFDAEKNELYDGSLFGGGLKRTLRNCDSSDFNFKVAAIRGDQKIGWTLVVDGKNIGTFKTSQGARIQLGTLMSTKVLKATGFMYKEIVRDANGNLIEE